MLGRAGERIRVCSRRPGLGQWTLRCTQCANIQWTPGALSMLSGRITVWTEQRGGRHSVHATERVLGGSAGERIRVCSRRPGLRPGRRLHTLGQSTRNREADALQTRVRAGTGSYTADSGPGRHAAEQRASRLGQVQLKTGFPFGQQRAGSHTRQDFRLNSRERAATTAKHRTGSQSSRCTAAEQSWFFPGN